MLLPRGVLKLAMCAASEKTRYAMDGLALERTADGTVKVTATDGKRLVCAVLAPMTATAKGIAATFGIGDTDAGPCFRVIPTRDDVRNGETISRGLLSLMRDERRAVLADRKAVKGTDAGPRKPGKPKMTALPKRPKLPPLPILPKRSAFEPNTGESIDAALARFNAERSEASERRKAVKAERKALIVAWKEARATVKARNIESKAEHKRAIVAWKEARENARREARTARDVVAVDIHPDRDSLIGIAFAPRRVREMSALEGHYPPVDDVMPRADRAHSHELIVDAEAMRLIVEAWRAALRADERATCGEQGNIQRADELTGIVIELEGHNVKMSARLDGRAFELSEAQREHIERWMRVVHGQGKMRIGINAFLLSEMAEALNAAIGKPGSRYVRLGIKSDSDAVLVAPCAVDEASGPAFAPCVRGVSVSGVLMPINLA